MENYELDKERSEMRPRALLIHGTITTHDAIGNDIAAMYELLSSKYECKCFAINAWNRELEYVDEAGARDIIGDKDALVIFHHSVNWQLIEDMLADYKCKLVIKYHNITPPEFFEPYKESDYLTCKHGREQTKRLLEKFPRALWLADSDYNALDLEGGDVAVCPPFNKVDEWDSHSPDENLLKSLLYAKTINLLFVGRVAPNKGHLMLLDIVSEYIRRYGDGIKLYVIGKPDAEKYSMEIMNKIERLNIADNVEFIGEINDSILMAYYLGCDIYMNVSDHEGFCVPIVEAQKLMLPIIAKDSSAVGETLGTNQILLGEDVEEYVEEIHALMNDRDRREQLREWGYKNYQSRFCYDKIASTFKDFLAEKVGVKL